MTVSDPSRSATTPEVPPLHGRLNRTPRILIVNENGSVPSDRRVWDIATTLVEAACEVVVVCPQGDARERARGERALFEVIDGVAVHRFPLPFAAGGPIGYVREYGIALWRTWRLTRRLCRERPFDVVHACNPPDLMLLAALPARWRGARLIFDHHDLTPELFEARFGARHRGLYRLTLVAERLSFALADVAIATNDSYAEVARTRGEKRSGDVFVVRNGPDLRRFGSRSPDPALKRGKPLLIAYVGVIATQDGVDHAVRALAHLRRRRTDWHATIAGEGEARADLERLATELGIADCVDFPGWLDDEQITRLLATADVCLAPEPPTAFNECSTIVKIAEYMAMARPVVAYALRESRRTAAGAAAYARPDDVGSFADCLEELLDDPQRRERMGSAGRTRVERELSWQRSQTALLAAYRRALRVNSDQRPGSGSRSAGLDAARS